MSSRKRSRLSWDDCASDDDNHDSDSDFEGDSKGSSARARARKSARKSPATGPATGPVKKVKNKSRKPTAVEQPLHANGSGFSHIGKDAVGLLVQFLSLADFLRLAVGLCKQHGILVPLGDKCKRLRIHKSVAADFFRFFWRTAVVLPSTGRRCESVHPEAKPLIKKFLVDSPTEGTICRLLCCPENDTSQPHLGHGSMLQMSWTKRLALRSRGIASQRKLAKSPSTDLKRMPVAAKMVCVFCTRPLVEWPIQSTRFGGIASWMRDAFKTDNYLHGFPSCGDCLPGNGTQLDTFDGQLGDLDTEDFLSRYLPMFLGKHFLLQDVHDLWYDIQGTNLVRTDDPGSFRLGEYKWHFPVRRAPGHPIRDGRHECVTTPLPVTCILSPSQLKQPHKNALETFAALPEEVREQFVVHATVTYKIMRKEAPAVPAPIAPAPAMPAPIAPAPVHQVQPLIIDDD